MSTLFIILKENLLQSIFQIALNTIRRNILCLLFTVAENRFFFFKCFQTSLIIKEWIRHENKFNRKVFSRTRKFWKTIFRIFMFHERLEKVYHEHFMVVYTMKLSWNAYSMKCSERNISLSILVFRHIVSLWNIIRIKLLSSKL